MPQKVYEPEPTFEQDASEDEDCHVRSMRQNLLSSEPVSQTRQGCPFLLNESKPNHN